MTRAPQQPAQSTETSAANARPDVSVILCTRNRAALLRPALEKVAAVMTACAPVRVELLLINNNSTDDTAKVITTFIKDYPALNTTAIFAAKPGLAAARNAGMKVAQGRILMFCDDDGELAPDYFTVLTRLYAQDKGMVMRGGRVLLGNPADQPYTIKTDTEAATYGGRYPGGFIHGCNMSFAREIYERIGLMDERFGAGATFPSADESDYIHRAYKAGAQVHYCPELLVHHHHGRRDLADIRKLFDGYMIGDGALFAKHWNNGLLRCLAGNIGNAVKSIWRRDMVFDATLGFSYADAALGNLRGFVRYWLKG